MKRMSSRALRFFRLITLVFVTHGFIYANGLEKENMDMDTLLFQEIPCVLTATMTPESINDVPGSVTVISKKEIQYFGYQTLIDLYNRIPGFQVTQSSDNEMCGIVRGFTPGANEHIKIMIDGHHVTEYLACGNWAWADYPLCNVEQVEIIRGPGSSLYGANAISAVINIITDKSKRVSLNAGAGDLGYANGNVAVYSDPEKDLSFSFTGDYLEEEGEEEHYEKGLWYGTPFSASVIHQDDKKRYGSCFSARYKNLELTLNYADHKDFWNKNLSSSLTDNPIRMESLYAYSELKYIHPFSDTISWVTKFSYDYMSQIMEGAFTPPMAWGIDTNGDGLEDVFPADLNNDGFPEYWSDGMFINNAETSTDCYILDTYLNFEYGINKLLLGFYYNRKTLRDVDFEANFYPATFLRAPDNTRIPSEQSYILGEGEIEHIYALYLQDIVSLTDATKLILGTRYDDYSEEGSKWSPRTALIYKLPANHALKISYGESFFAPYNMCRYSNTVGFYGNPDIKSQENKSYEVSFQNEFQSPLFYNIAFFYNQARDIISPNSEGVFTNAGSADFKGFEIELQWNATNRFFLFSNYTYVNAVDRTLHSEYVFSAEYMGNIGFSYEILSNLSFSSHIHISGPQARLATLPEGNDKLDGWETVNAALVYKVNENFNISLSAKNLFDEEYYYASTETNYYQTVLTDDYPAQGRKVLLNMNYRY